MVLHVPKPRQLKPWPNLTGILPLLSVFDFSSRKRSGKVHLDLSNVYRVDAIGLSIFIARISQYLDPLTSVLILSMPHDKNVHECIVSLGLHEHLQELGFIGNVDKTLFDIFNIESRSIIEPSDNIKSSQKIFQKIISIIPSNEKSREQIIAKVKEQVKDFLRRDIERKIAQEQVMIVLLELVKNTVDHSGHPATLALMLETSDVEPMRFTFSYCDTGNGICHSVRRHMQNILEKVPAGTNPSDQTFQLARLFQKGGFTDLIHWALQPGNSTKIGNGVNFGLGLMLIVEASKRCGFRLSVKDADSMIMLNELSSMNTKEVATPYSHAQIRQFGVATCTAPLLMFHGELQP